MHTTSMNLSVFMRTGKWMVMINKGKEGSVSSRNLPHFVIGGSGEQKMERKKMKGSTVLALL